MVKELQQLPFQPNLARPKLGNVSAIFEKKLIVDLEQTRMLALAHKKTEEEET